MIDQITIDLRLNKSLPKHLEPLTVIQWKRNIKYNLKYNYNKIKDDEFFRDLNIQLQIKIISIITAEEG